MLRLRILPTLLVCAVRPSPCTVLLGNAIRRAHTPRVRPNQIPRRPLGSATPDGKQGNALRVAFPTSVIVMERLSAAMTGNDHQVTA